MLQLMPGLTSPSRVGIANLVEQNPVIPNPPKQVGVPSLIMRAFLVIFWNN